MFSPNDIWTWLIFIFIKILMPFRPGDFHWDHHISILFSILVIIYYDARPIHLNFSTLIPKLIFFFYLCCAFSWRNSVPLFLFSLELLRTFRFRVLGSLPLVFLMSFFGIFLFYVVLLYKVCLTKKSSLFFRLPWA